MITLAYVTYQDIRKISGLKDQTVIVVKAPPETKLEVPDPVEVRRAWRFLPAYRLFFCRWSESGVSLTMVRASNWCSLGSLMPRLDYIGA